MKNQLEFCFSMPLFYPCDCIQCKNAKDFTTRLHKTLQKEYEQSDIALAIKRAKSQIER